VNDAVEAWGGRGAELKAVPDTRREVVVHQPLGHGARVGERPPDALRRMRVDHLEV
jgi:hypothetical protein